MKKSLHSVFLIFLVIVGCFHAHATVHVVQVSNYTFIPSAVGNIAVGDTIHFTWINGTHTTTSTSVPNGAATWNAPMDNAHTTFDYPVTVSGNYSFVCSIHSSMTGTFTATPPCSLTVNLGADTTVCGSTITLDAGNAGATYAWSNGTTQQTDAITVSGTYSVTVSNNGCTATDTKSVILHANPIVILTQNVVNCGPYVLDASNAGAGTYNWSDAHNYSKDTILFSGVYTVTFTDGNNCTAYKSSTVIIHDKPVVNLGNDTSTCNGAILLDAGNPGASYAWSGHTTARTLNVTTSGTYIVIVTDTHNCTSADTISITIGSPSVNLGNDTVACGSTFVLNAGNPGGTYLWSDGHRTQLDTISTAGTYSVTVTLSGGCTATDLINVLFHPKPVVDLGPDTSACAKPTLDAGNAGATYHWTTNDTTETITVPSAGGIFGVTVTANGCSNDDRIILDPCTGIEPEMFGTIQLYPNPSDGSFRLVMEQSTAMDMNIEITAVTGQKVWAIDHENATGKYVRDFNLQHLANGLYYVRLISGKDVLVRKVILQ